MRRTARELCQVDPKTQAVTDAEIHEAILAGIDPAAAEAMEQATRRRLVADGWDPEAVELLYPRQRRRRTSTDLWTWTLGDEALRSPQPLARAAREAPAGGPVVRVPRRAPPVLAPVGSG
jgi:hypothetical protein